MFRIRGGARFISLGAFGCGHRVGPGRGGPLAAADRLEDHDNCSHVITASAVAGRGRCQALVKQLHKKKTYLDNTRMEM